MFVPNLPELVNGQRKLSHYGMDLSTIRQSILSLNYLNNQTCLRGDSLYSFDEAVIEKLTKIKGNGPTKNGQLYAHSSCQSYGK